MSRRSAFKKAHACIAVALVGGLIALVPLADGAGGRRAVTFTVDTTEDDRDATPGDGICRADSGRCTLRAALNEASSLPSDGTPIRIVLGAATYALTRDPPTVAANDSRGGDLDLTGHATAPSAVEIIGAGAGRTIVVQRRADRVLHIFTRAPVTIANLTIRGGNGVVSGGGISDVDARTPVGGLTLRGVEITGNSATSLGGGVYGAHSRLVIDGSTIEDNNSMSYGGGLYLLQGTLAMTGSTISGNTARSAGGGLFANSLSPTLEITRSLIAGNSLTGGSGQGGGIHITSGNSPSSHTAVRITYSTIRGNMATDGAGLRVAARAGVTIEWSLFKNNTAVHGGGISMYSLPITQVFVINSTLSGNDSERGGAIYSSGVQLVLRASTIAANTALTGSGIMGADPHRVTGTIVANEPATTNCAFLVGGRLADGGSNIENGTTCGLRAPDRSSTDPRLGALADNGGPTQTHALLDGSPAIDTYTAGDCPGTDQRGYIRPGGAACDIGAFERGAAVVIGLIPGLISYGVIGGWLTLMPSGEMRATSLEGGDFRPCTAGKSMRLTGARGVFEPNDAQVMFPRQLIFRRSAQNLVRLGNLQVLLDGRVGRVLALLAPTAGPLPLFTIDQLRYGQRSAHGRLRLTPAAARVLNRLLRLRSFRAGMGCGELDLQLRIGRDPGPPRPVDVSPPPPPPPPPAPPPPPPPQAQTFTLSVSVEPSDGGEVSGPGIDCPSDCSETYAAGTSVTLTRDADDDFEFDHWEGACSGGSSTCGVTMDANKSVTAKFKPKPQQQPQCSDGKDNDNDGFTDFSGQDPQCSSPNDDDESK